MRLMPLVACLGMVAVAACAPQRATPPAAPALRVLVPRDTPPYAFRQDDRLVGLEVDFARELATALGRPLDLVEMDFGDIIPTLQGRRADLAMAGLTITPGRQVLISFSEPYLRSGLLSAMRRGDLARFKTASSVLRTSDPIGVVAATTADGFVREHAPNAAPTVYPTARAAMDELRQRRVSFVVHDAPVVVWFVAGDEANLGALLQLLDEEQLGWGLARDDETLRGAVNGTLARWRANGTLERIIGRWLPYWRRLEAGTPSR